MEKRVLIEYVLRETVSIEDVEREIGSFVAGIAGLDVGIRYASHRKKDIDRAYAHIAIVPNAEASAVLQSAPFFTRFTTFLRDACREGPNVTTLELVASTVLHRCPAPQSLESGQTAGDAS